MYVDTAHGDQKVDARNQVGGVLHRFIQVDYFATPQILLFKVALENFEFVKNFHEQLKVGFWRELGSFELAEHDRAVFEAVSEGSVLKGLVHEVGLLLDDPFGVFQ